MKNSLHFFQIIKFFFQIKLSLIQFLEQLFYKINNFVQYDQFSFTCPKQFPLHFFTIFLTIN